MKVITIKQPFASLISYGLKEYEFRTWKTNYRGEIYIHAGKGIDKSAMKRYEYLNLDYPSGCIIAKAKITDCIYIDSNMKDILRKKDDKVYYGIINSKNEEYGFKLENIERIEPITINGQLGIWNYEKE